MLAVERREAGWREYDEPLDVARLLKLRAG
jgi:hypothetical protein